MATVVELSSERGRCASGEDKKSEQMRWRRHQAMLLVTQLPYESTEALAVLKLAETLLTYVNDGTCVPPF